MKYKYQVIFLGDVINPACDEIRNRFFDKIREIGILDDALETITASNFAEKYDNKRPAFVYYFGKEGHNNCDENILNVLLENGDAIVPVFFKTNNFENEIPSAISQMNGKQYTSDEVDKFVNYSFESLRLLRQTRKLFISYRRVDQQYEPEQGRLRWYRLQYPIRPGIFRSRSCRRSELRSISESRRLQLQQLLLRSGWGGSTWPGTACRWPGRLPLPSGRLRLRFSR